MALRRFTLAVIQLKVGENKVDNIAKATRLIKEAKEKGSKIVALPECFNSPYGTSFFEEYAEEIPSGETCKALSTAAKENKVYLVGGSIPETNGTRLYNTCTVWDPEGNLIAKHRKVHLFDIDIPNGIKFKESDVLSPGNNFTTFQTDFCKVGLGICYDLRFEEMARIYRKQECDVILYPGAFNLTTGPMHWDLLLRSRAVDNQVFVAGIAPATDKSSKYVSYGHSIVISPWGKTIEKAEHDEAVLYADVDLDEVSQVRQQIPTSYQRRNDIYETVYKL